MKKIGDMKRYSASEIHKSRVSIGFECLDRQVFKPEKCYELLGRSGVKYARCQTGWARCEKEKGVFDFRWLDEIVDALLAQGVRPWLDVTFGNPLYMPDASNPAGVGCVPLLYGPEVMEAWKRFVRQVARRYRDRVTHYEIWNEPDCNQFWYPGESDAAQYAELVAVTGGVIREEFPGAQIGASVAAHSLTPYVERLVQCLPPDGVDFFCYHVYSMRPEENYLADVDAMRAAFRQNGLGHVAFWQGESGYPSFFPPHHWLHPRGQGSEHQQAVWQLRRYILDLAAGAAMTSFFQMADMMERPYEKAREVLTSPARHGILNGLTYTPKKSYETISRLATLLSGDVAPAVWPISAACPGAEETPLAFAFCRNGAPLYAYYLPTDIEAECPLRPGCTVRLGAPGLKRPVLLDPFTGEGFLLDAEVTRRGDSLTLTGLPIGEYPLILCEEDAFEFV